MTPEDPPKRNDQQQLDLPSYTGLGQRAGAILHRMEQCNPLALINKKLRWIVHWKSCTIKESEHLKCVLLDRLEFACLAYIHSGKCTYHMCTNEERLSMSQEIYLRSTLVKWWIVHWKSCTMKECEHLKCVLLDISRVVLR